MGDGASEVGFVKFITNDEVGKYLAIGTAIVRVDPKYFRGAEVETLLGDPTLAHRELGWKPATDLKQLIMEMIDFDYEEAKKSRFLTDAGYSSVSPYE